MARLSALVIIGILIISTSSPAAGEQLIVGDFSGMSGNQTLPENWEPLHFKDITNYTDYQAVKIEQGCVIKATSKGSSSGLIRKIRIDPHKYPVVEWSWKVSNVYEKGNAHEKSGDDYPARIYITFAYEPDKVGFFQKVKFKAIKLVHGEYPPTSALNYIWASNLELGATLPNPYTDKVKMIAVESGSGKVGQWVRERRNILEDYRAIHGEEPPEISGVAIMTDSDNTGEEASAWYGDIVFKAR